VIGAIDVLSSNAAFVEARGQEIGLRLPGGTLQRYVPAEPAGTWALNLALLARPPLGLPGLPGIVPRGTFRLDLETDERGAMLVRQWVIAAESSARNQEMLACRLQRGRDALANLSRNARASATWLLIAAMGTLFRPHIVRALELSRAGGDIQARALANAGLVKLEKGGGLRLTPPRTYPTPSEALEDAPLSAAAAALDESVSAIDRLLADIAAKS
jgi:hypothetical protein